MQLKFSIQLFATIIWEKIKYFIPYIRDNLMKFFDIFYFKTIKVAAEGIQMYSFNKKNIRATNLIM